MSPRANIWYTGGYMKSLSPANPRVLFVVGIPGAGKTYFAEQFAETFGAPFIEYDAIRAQLTQHPSYSREEDATVARLARHQLGELLKTNHPIIFEGGCESRTDRTALIRFVQEFGYQPMLIWIQTEPATAMRRAVLGVRGHSNRLIPEERFNSLVRRFTPPSNAERPVVLSGKHTYTSQSRAILRHLAQAGHDHLFTSNDPSIVRPAVHIPRRNIGGSSISIQ